LPAYATSDSRLGRFNATTFGAKVGLRLGSTGELYARAERYEESGPAHPAGAPAGLANLNFFSGVRADTVIVGYTFAFK
jgi:hypothetical protein